MTFGSLWGQGSAPSAPAYYSPAPKFYAGERGDTAGGGYPYSSSNSGGQWKSKKADKKQAAMSALTLIAFLFFLNILKECIQEEMHPTTAEIMMVPAPPFDAINKEDPIEPMGKYEELDLKTKDNFVRVRKLLSIISDEEREEKESNGLLENFGDELVKGGLPVNVLSTVGKDTSRTMNVVKGRKLLGVVHEGEDVRQGKFIQNYEPGRKDWTNELSQLSDDELVGQKQKLDQLRQLWKRKATEDSKRKSRPALMEEVERIKVKKFVNSPVLSDLKGIPKLSQYWAKQKTTSTLAPETKSVVFEDHQKKVADFEEFEALDSNKPQHGLDKAESSGPSEVVQSLQLRAAPIGEIEEVSDPFLQEDPLNTPRYRRSDEILTTLPTEELFRPEVIQVVTPNPTGTSEAFSTTRRYHVFTNPAQIYSNIWKTTTPLPSTTTTTIPSTQSSNSNKVDIDDIYFTTTKPPSSRYQPMLYPNHRASYKAPSRYRYAPNRRVSYEAPVVRQEYYPMSVVGQYGGDEETSGLGGVFQLLWTFVSSFAKPMARIIPGMSSKVGGEPQCFDLLACEAHRLGHYMGPTAKAIATTFSTVLLWVTPPSDKPVLDAAITAGQENSCLEQIAACDDRSGGKSAMTMVAQLVELRGENARRPKS